MTGSMRGRERGSGEGYPPASGDRQGWLRIFATPLPGEAAGPARGAVAVLVDTRPFFDGLTRLDAEPGTRLLLLDPAGRPAPATDPELLPHLGEAATAGRSPGLRALVREMRAERKRGAGSGLGLSVVAQIVRNHRGEIELESEPGRGTRVTLLWPTAAATAAREEEHGDAA